MALLYCCKYLKCRKGYLISKSWRRLFWAITRENVLKKIVASCVLLDLFYSFLGIWTLIFSGLGIGFSPVYLSFFVRKLSAQMWPSLVPLIWRGALSVDKKKKENVFISLKYKFIQLHSTHLLIPIEALDKGHQCLKRWGKIKKKVSQEV